MTIEGAIADINNLINAEDIPIYYKPSLEKIKETIEFEKQPCEDSISRIDLIAVMHLIMDDAKIGDNDEDYECLDDIKEQYIEIAKGLPSVQPEMKWIPVSEKLPYPNEYVLVTMISDVTQTPYVTKIYTGENVKESLEDAIAWMRLPKPYKEKK